MYVCCVVFSCVCVVCDGTLRVSSGFAHASAQAVLTLPNVCAAAGLTVRLGCPASVVVFGRRWRRAGSRRCAESQLCDSRLGAVVCGGEKIFAKTFFPTLSKSLLSNPILGVSHGWPDGRCSKNEKKIEKSCKRPEHTPARLGRAERSAAVAAVATATAHGPHSPRPPSPRPRALGRPARAPDELGRRAATRAGGRGRVRAGQTRPVERHLHAYQQQGR